MLPASWWQSLRLRAGWQVIEAVALVVTALPTEQRRAVLDVMLQPLVQQAQRLLAAPPAASSPADAAHRKDLTLATFDRMAIVFKYAPAESCCLPFAASICQFLFGSVPSQMITQRWEAKYNGSNLELHC